MLEEFKTNKLKELNTPFGKLYIEPWEWHKDNIYPYDRRDRITIYDSRENFFDYFSIEYFYESWDEFDPEYPNPDDFALKEYNNLVEMLECGAQQKTLRDFLDWLGLDYDYAGRSKRAAEKALSPDRILLPDEIETNEYVNHIGDYYIVISDYA